MVSLIDGIARAGRAPPPLQLGCLIEPFDRVSDASSSQECRHRFEVVLTRSACFVHHVLNLRLAHTSVL